VWLSLFRGTKGLKLISTIIVLYFLFKNSRDLYSISIFPGVNAQWVTRAWLSNYQGGIVKRGLIGEILYMLPLSWDGLLKTAFVLQLSVYSSSIFFTMKLWFRHAVNSTSMLMLFAPAFFILFARNAAWGGFRKENIALLSFILFSLALKDGKVLHRYGVSALMVYSLAILSHEVAIFVLPFVFFLMYFNALTICENLTYKDFIFRHSKGIALYGVGYLFVTLVAISINFKFTATQQTVELICNSLYLRGAGDDVCDFALSAITGSMMNDAQRFIVNETVGLTYSLALAVLTMAPMMLVRWNSQKLKTKIVSPLVIGAFGFFPLFIVADDWGRWICMLDTTLFVIIFWLLSHKLIYLKKVPYLIVFLSSMLWIGPNMVEDVNINLNDLLFKNFSDLSDWIWLHFKKIMSVIGEFMRRI
jgi:hypothetical protein